MKKDMIILTGDEGFIGKKFLEKLGGKNVSKLKKGTVGIFVALLSGTR